MIKELLKRVRDTLQELEETHYDLYWDIQTALEQNEQEDAYAWSSVADYEKEVGFEVSDAFKAAWAMARTRLSYESTTLSAQPALEQEPVAWRKWDGYGFYFREYDTGGEPLYLAPPKREPPQTAREMYQRGYAKAERDLKREPLSDEVIGKERLQVPIGIWHFTSFKAGIRFAEKTHGIGKTK